MNSFFYNMCCKTHPSPAWRGGKAWEVFTLVIGCGSGAFLGAALSCFPKEATLLPSGFQLIIPTS
jgi:hypothetical protein